MTQISLRLDRPAAVQAAVDELATSGSEERGAILTRPEVVRFILDLVGYTSDQDLSTYRLLDPSCGHGAFVCAAAERLLEAPSLDVESLRDAIRAVELHERSFHKTRERLRLLLTEKGLDQAETTELLDVWLIQDDFLLSDLNGPFTHVVGNPPYVRHEAIPDVLTEAYKNRHDCIQGRADLYVPFIERGLKLLSSEGRLAFICPDRWIKNAYGKGLRQFIDQGFHLASYVDMTGADAFETEAAAYPSIFVIHRSDHAGSGTAVTRRPSLDDLDDLSHRLRNRGGDDPRIQIVPNAANGDEPWLLDHPEEIAILRRLETQHPTIEEAECKVGIGVATGADDIFVRRELPVEESRKLPVVKTADIDGGRLDWGGYHVLNPFDENGSLAPLSEFPAFAEYLAKHEERIRDRYIARKYPDRWYRTIDKIHPDLTHTPKLLIPDIKGGAAVAYDAGEFYPHHNVYHVTSSTWDLRALQAILRSKIAEFFVAMYSVRMRGDYLRFQAQYLRRIRVPKWQDVSTSMREKLREAATGDQSACDAAVFQLYDLSEEDADTIRSSVLDAKS